MTLDSKSPALWPFLAADAIFASLAVFIFSEAPRPLRWWEVASLILCAILCAATFIIPFLLRSNHNLSLGHAQKLADATEKIEKIDQLATLIGYSTAQWQIIQETSAKTVQAASELSKKMAAESTAFGDSLQKVNDAERTHLRLEADKLRRGENEWLQTVVRLLDQVHALYQAAVQSGQPELTAQIGQFQNASREIIRRVGVIPLAAQPGETFDAKRHQLLPNTEAPESALIQETLVPGFAYQGQLLRRPLVRLQEPVPQSV